MDDEFYIRRTLKLASKAQGLTSPNPMVGALLVKNGKIIAEDFHRKPGTPHAEALVLTHAGENARGAVLYVNLEPCCHTDKRTPPCTKAIIHAGVAKAVIGMPDPNPKVSGKGIAELKAAGISVVSGILEPESRKLNECYVKHITTGKPFVILKTAMTLDGKIATPEGQSKWITGEKSRRIVHALRSRADAVMTAIGTVQADNPQLTARLKGGKNPLRIVIDPDLKIPLNAKLLETPPRTLIVTKTKNAKAVSLEKGGINLFYFKGKLNLQDLMASLGQMGIASVLIEGGSSLNAHALEDGIVDKILFFIAPIIIGGRDSFPCVGGRTFKRLGDAYRIRDMKFRRIGEDLLIEGYL